MRRFRRRGLNRAPSLSYKKVKIKKSFSPTQRKPLHRDEKDFHGTTLVRSISYLRNSGNYSSHRTFEIVQIFDVQLDEYTIH